ncbi:hypothetical protein HC766_05385 [Candidatus Gracilibacteria bacterium]|nr:hypothetical protein [Candidatus Gracilibacteria bacterium]
MTNIYKIFELEGIRNNKLQILRDQLNDEFLKQKINWINVVKEQKSLEKTTISRIFQMFNIENNSIDIYQSISDLSVSKILDGKGKIKKIALVGKPGAGKTTLLEKIYEDILNHKNNNSYFPIWISLRYLNKNLFKNT